MAFTDYGATIDFVLARLRCSITRGALVKSRTDAVILNVVGCIASLIALVASAFMALMTIGMTHGQEGLWFNIKTLVPAVVSFLVLVGCIRGLAKR
jgi:hypothetical protein